MVQGSSTATARGIATIETVFLDVGGVLLLPDHDRVCAALEGVGFQPDRSLLDRALYTGSAALAEWPGHDAGISARFNDAYARALGVPDAIFDEAVDALKEAFSHPAMWSRPAPGAHETVRALVDAGVSVAVVSNANGQVADRLRDAGICQAGPGAATPVTAILDSSIVGVAKPDPGIFALALDATASAPERAVHVGDIVGADVVGARAAGVRPLHLDPHGFCPFDDHDHLEGLAQLVDLVQMSLAGDS